MLCFEVTLFGRMAPAPPASWQRDRVADFGAEAIHDASGDEQSHGVRGAEGRNDIAVIDFAPAKHNLEVLGEKSQNLSVNVIDGGGEEQQRADHPAVTANSHSQINAAGDSCVSKL